MFLFGRLVLVSALTAACVASGITLVAAQSHGPETSDPAPDPPAPPPEHWKLSGYVFGDYYYFAANNDATFEGQHGFWIRRAYLTYDHALSPTFATRVRLEVTSNGKLSGGALTPYVKDAYLKWSVHGRHPRPKDEWARRHEGIPGDSEFTAA